MALEVLTVLALRDVGKHFVVHLVCRAVGDPERPGASVSSLWDRGLTTSRTPLRAYPLRSRQPAVPFHQGRTLGLVSWARCGGTGEGREPSISRKE